ncbi:uncharacterized protein [Pseudorca crassidens]|uniref:uncharacterized protein n=1 Tax=Pseudorca crassidens TaxID=82174 RepID=UPI00352D1CA3
MDLKDHSKRAAAGRATEGAARAGRRVRGSVLPRGGGLAFAGDVGLLRVARLPSACPAPALPPGPPSAPPEPRCGLRGGPVPRKPGSGAACGTLVARGRGASARGTDPAQGPPARGPLRGQDGGAQAGRGEVSWSRARRGASLPRPGLGPRAVLPSPGERRVGKMYQRVCLLGPRFPEQLSPVSTMLSHLPRVSREGNYFAHVLNWLQVRSSCCFWCLPPMAKKWKGEISFTEAESRGISGEDKGERRSCRAPASLPRPEDRRPPKPLAWLGPTEPAAQHSGESWYQDHTMKNLGVPMANPAERKGGTEMREKIKGTLGATWCCCRPKSRFLCVCVPMMKTSLK